jgi:hypothetical protein
MILYDVQMDKSSAAKKERLVPECLNILKVKIMRTILSWPASKSAEFTDLSRASVCVE